MIFAFEPFFEGRNAFSEGIAELRKAAMAEKKNHDSDDEDVT
jgi:hypothetical protein